MLFLILIQYSIRLSKLTNRYKDLTQQLSIIDHELAITTMDLLKVDRTNKAYFYVLAASVGAREKYTSADIHCKVKIIQVFSTHLKYSYKEQEALEFAAILHDIGKINIPISALYKTSKLSKAEWDLVKKHPLTSVSIIEGIPFLLASIPIIQYHHEHWDGSGYPEGLQGDEIPEGARILSLVDTLVALTSNRPYRKAFSINKAKVIVDELSGKKFDPQIVTALHECWDQVEHILSISDLQPVKSKYLPVLSDKEISVSKLDQPYVVMGKKEREDSFE
jgi:HD-GYP domain-containing protein (c-di-GMP phosphodiesterase class II)